MHIFLSILQVLLALHTVMGAIWKFSNPSQNVMSLQAIPHKVWMALIGVELLCSVGLVLPIFSTDLGWLVPTAALTIAGEMFLFCVMHRRSGEANNGPMKYWLVVAGFCVLIAIARLLVPTA